MIHYLYKTTCLPTGKYYVGMHSTTNENDKYLGSGKLLLLSIKKYGREAHSKEILEYHKSREDLSVREAEYITELMVNDLLCMNLKYGGEGSLGIGYKHTDEAKKKISDYVKKRNSENHPMAGKTQSGESKEKNRNSQRGKKHKKETIERMSMAKLGKKHSEESKRKMSNNKKGLVPVNRTPVIIAGVEYKSLCEACELTGINLSTLRHRLRSSSEKFKNYYYQ